MVTKKCDQLIEKKDTHRHTYTQRTHINIYLVKIEARK